MNDTNSLIDYIQKWGNAASIALFDPIFQTFSTPSIAGTIGYRIESGCAVVFGDPVCPPEHGMALIQQFQEFCEQQKLSIVYVTVSPSFAQNMKTNAQCSLLTIGDEIIIDPMRNTLQESGSNARLLRKKYNNAVREGIIVKEYLTIDEGFEQECQELQKEWLSGRKGLQIYLSSVNLFANRTNKRWFYAKKNEKLVGLLMLNRIGMNNGWVQNMLMLNSDAPPSTSELLVLSALEILRSENCTYYSIGSAPDNITHVEGLGRVKTALIRASFKIIKKIFKLNGRSKYWEKFSPIRKPSYIVLPKGRLSIKKITAIMRAFNVKF